MPGCSGSEVQFKRLQEPDCRSGYFAACKDELVGFQGSILGDLQPDLSGLEVETSSDLVQFDLAAPVSGLER